MCAFTMPFLRATQKSIHFSADPFILISHMFFYFFFFVAHLLWLGPINTYVCADLAKVFFFFFLFKIDVVKCVTLPKIYHGIFVQFFISSSSSFCLVLFLKKLKKKKKDHVRVNQLAMTKQRLNRKGGRKVKTVFSVQTFNFRCFVDRCAWCDSMSDEWNQIACDVICFEVLFDNFYFFFFFVQLLTTGKKINKIKIASGFTNHLFSSAIDENFGVAFKENPIIIIVTAENLMWFYSSQFDMLETCDDQSFLIKFRYFHSEINNKKKSNSTHNMNKPMKRLFLDELVD